MNIYVNHIKAGVIFDCLFPVSRFVINQCPL